MPHLPPVNEGAGVVNVVPFAQFVEFFLVDESIHEVAVDVGGHTVGGEGLPILSGQLYIAVSAADDQHCLPGKLCCHSSHILPEGLCVLIFCAYPVVDDVRSVGRA